MKYQNNKGSVAVIGAAILAVVALLLLLTVGNWNNVQARAG